MKTEKPTTILERRPGRGQDASGNLPLLYHTPPETIPALPVSLTDVQATAIDLHRRGFNVVPLKRHEKKPYILEPFFTSRLHHCDSNCKHRGRDDISDLFTRNNVGVITGRTSGNLLDIDCDSQDAFAKIGQQLKWHSLPFWAIATYTGGRYLLRIAEGEAHNKPKHTDGLPYCKAKEVTNDTKFSDVEFWGSHRLVVVPPSIHPSGIVYQWVTPEPRLYLPPRETLPAVSIAALEWLGVTLEKTSREWEEPESFGLPEWTAVLTLETRRTLADTPKEGFRNTAIFKAACDMKANGIDYRDAEHLILELADRAGTPRREAQDTLKSAYKKERTTARQYFGSGRAATKEWQRAGDLAQSFDWRGTFGRTALKRRAVYLACIERARLDGRLHWRATTREVAELANTSAKRAGESLHDLERAGLILRVNSGRNAGLYRFAGLSKLTTLDTTGRCSVVTLDTPKTQAEQDVFGRLGLAAWHVWRWLLAHTAQTAGEIARVLGLPRSSVYEALRRLESLGLAARSAAEGGAYYAEPVTDGSLAGLAVSLNEGASPSQTRKEQHRLERERRLNRLTRQAIESYRTNHNHKE